MPPECPYCQQELPAGFVNENNEVVMTIEQIAEEVEAADYGEEVDVSKPRCGAPLDDGLCSRTVEEPGERCWQHVD